MKKILIIMMSVMLVCVAVTPASAEWTETQVKSHTIATMARSMGLADDNPIIAEASRIWWMEQQAVEQAEAEAKAEFLQSYHNEAVMIAKVMYCEAKGISSKRELSMIAWTILNRFDNGGFGSTIPAIITARNQFAYSRNAPTVNQCGIDLLALSEDVLLRWQSEREGQTDVGRTLPKNYCFYWGDGHHNYFRTSDRGKGYLWFEGCGDPYQ
jgi:hypothetical protein